MRRRTEASIMVRLVRNQDSQWMALPSPITFIASFKRSSFSYTMLFTTIATVKIHASVMNIGMLREMASVNLHVQRRPRHTGLPHIGDLIQKRRHALFGHIVRMDPQAPAHVALKLFRDIV